jgi:hypothetical protein
MYDEYGDPVTACVLVDVDPNDARAGMWPDTGLFGEKERTLLDVIDRLMTIHNTAAIRSSLWEAGSGLKEWTFHRSRGRLLAGLYVRHETPWELVTLRRSRQPAIVVKRQVYCDPPGMDPMLVSVCEKWSKPPVCGSEY